MIRILQELQSQTHERRGMVRGMGEERDEEEEGGEEGVTSLLCRMPSTRIQNESELQTDHRRHENKSAVTKSANQERQVTDSGDYASASTKNPDIKRNYFTKKLRQNAVEMKKYEPASVELVKDAEQETNKKLTAIRRFIAKTKAKKEEKCTNEAKLLSSQVNGDAGRNIPGMAKAVNSARNHMSSGNGKLRKSSSGGDTVGDVCRIEDSPFRIMKVASGGNLKEFERLYLADTTRLSLKDPKGMTVTHHAATKGRTRILEFIVTHHGDINMQDKKGNTPLHVAVEKGKREYVKDLLKYSANTSILNESEMAVIHLAVDIGDSDTLKILLEDRCVDVNLPGEKQLTSLHYAACKDRKDCSLILLEHGADICRENVLGIPPALMAAKHAAHQVLNALLQHAQTLPDPDDVLLALDKDQNGLLHAAVYSGSLQTVSMCLQFDLAVDAQQLDKSTSLHLACAQGNLEMVSAMIDSQPDKSSNALYTKDCLEMSPLLTATLYDHTAIVEYLIKQGSDVNDRDKEERTPLLIAASNHSQDTMTVLLQQGADIYSKDKKSRTFLHLVIISGAKLHEFGKEVFEKAKPLLNEIDDYGCTPLHYASKGGHLSAIESLITMGAFLNIKNKDKKSPLHFAACYGRLNTCRRLLESRQGVSIINETDGEGHTAIHLASKNGHAKVVQYLIQKGAILNKCHSGNTPIHLSAENGYTQTVKLLLGLHSHMMNAKNNNGDTALHLASLSGHSTVVTLLMSMKADFLPNNKGCFFFDLAIENCHKDVAMSVITHERWQDAMALVSSRGSPLILLVKHLPDACMAVLDRCQSTSGYGRKDQNFFHHYNFNYLQNPQCGCTYKQKEATPLLALNVMVRYNRVDCLSHPLCVNFLKMKWRAYGMWFHLINIGLYLLYLFFLTTFVCTFDKQMHTDNGMKLNWTTGIYEPLDQTDSFHSGGNTKMNMTQVPIFHRICILTLSIFCLLNMVKEVIQMIQQRSKYFRDPNNFFEWVLYIASAFFIIPMWFNYCTHQQWQAGAIAVFLAWFNLLLYLQRFDFFGIYVVMFMEILKTLVQVIVVFSVLIVAFGLSFYVLLSGQEKSPHQTPVLSILRVYMMMQGELDYVNSFVDAMLDDDPRTMHYKTLTLIFLVMFILFMPILLMNLLIGLAVGDIEAVQQNARLKRLAMQVELHTDLERKLPQKLLSYVDKTEYKVYPSCSGSPCSRIIARLCGSSTKDADQSEDVCATSASADARDNIFLIDAYQQQKHRMKELSAQMERQHELLKLVVQKMEIRTEADEFDSSSMDFPSAVNIGRSRTLPSLSDANKTVLRHVGIAAHWTKYKKSDSSNN